MSDSGGSRKLLWLLLSVLSGGSMAWYVTAIWSANQPAHFNDLYAPWWAAHEMLRHGRNPYSPEIAHEIQTVIYGAPAHPTSANDPASISGGFSYPPYAAFLLWPTVYLSFAGAQRVFLLVSLAAMLLSIVLWVRTLRLPLEPLGWLTLTWFAFGSFPALQGLKLQNLSVIAAALLAITIYLLSSGHLALAGMFLAISTFKPQFTIALIPGLALWTFNDWGSRRRLALSFLFTMLVLVASSEWFVPGWIVRFLQVIRAYRHYTYGHSFLDVWFTPNWGMPLGLCVLALTLFFLWKMWLHDTHSTAFIRSMILLLAVTLVIIPSLAPHAQLLLLPGFLLFLDRGNPLSSRMAKLAQGASWTLLAWSWIAAWGLFVGALLFPVSRLLRYWGLPLYGSPLLPLAVSLALVFSLPSGHQVGIGGTLPEIQKPDLQTGLAGQK